MPSQTRQLAAIMFTDIVGYTAMMGRDEDKALQLLSKNREIQKPLIEKYKGKWIKEMGDGILARFDSAYNATKCAIEIQRAAKNLLGAQLRIGLHLGEILVENDDIFGDDVNVASRIESIAEPGGIYISEPIYKALHNHTDVHSTFLGPVLLKNVEELVKIFYVANDGISTPSKQRIKDITKGTLGASSGRRNKRLGIAVALILLLTLLALLIFQNKPVREISSIAVLPFANLTGDKQEQPIIDMLHDALTGEISKIGKLIVKGRTSTMQFRDTQLGITEIARLLDVDALIEASVYKSGDSIYMQVQLIKTRPEEDHIQSWEFKRDTRYIFSLFGDLAKSVAKEIEISLTPQEEHQLTYYEEVNPLVYKNYQLGLYHLLGLSKDGIEKSKEYFELVLEMEPDHALAHAGMCMFYVGYAQQGHISFFEAGPLADYHASRALEENNKIPEVHKAAAWNAWMQWRLKEYLDHYNRALELDPNYSEVLAFMGQALLMEDMPEKAIMSVEKAMKLDRLNDTYKALYTMCLYFTQRYEDAYLFVNQALRENPDHVMLNSSLRAVLHAKEMYEEEYQSWLKKYSMSNDSIAVIELKKGHDAGGYEAAIQHLINHLIRQFKYTSDFIPAWQIATLYARIGDKDKTIFWLEKSYDLHSISLPFILIDPLFDSIRKDKKFISLVNKLNANR